MEDFVIENNIGIEKAATMYKNILGSGYPALGKPISQIKGVKEMPAFIRFEFGKK